MKIEALDHIVLVVRDVAASLAFYEEVLGLEPREERPGKWSLHFGEQKISLQSVEGRPPIAARTNPGSGNFCFRTRAPIGEVLARLEAAKVAVIEGPGERSGAIGTITSVYFRDPDGNLVEVGSTAP